MHKVPEQTLGVGGGVFGVACNKLSCMARNEKNKANIAKHALKQARNIEI